MAGLIVCTTAHSFPMLMIGRILQACSNGITTSLAQVVLLTIYPPEEKGTIMGWYGLSLGAAPVIAPTIAGLFVDTVGWRMIFIVGMFFITISTPVWVASALFVIHTFLHFYYVVYRNTAINLFSGLYSRTKTICNLIYIV